MKINFVTGCRQVDSEGNGVMYLKLSLETSDQDSFQKFVAAIRGAMAPEVEEKPAAMGFQQDEDAEA